MPENEKDPAHSGRMMDKSNTGDFLLNGFSLQTDGSAELGDSEKTAAAQTGWDFTKLKLAVTRKEKSHKAACWFGNTPCLYFLLSLLCDVSYRGTPSYRGTY